MAKIFTEDEVVGMREKWNLGMLDVRMTARFYGVSTETIRRACRGDTYANYGGLSDEKVDHRYPSNLQQEKVDIGSAVAQSLQRLQDMMAEPVKPQTEADHTRRSMPPDPFATGGIDDPGEDRVLV